MLSKTSVLTFCRTNYYNSRVLFPPSLKHKSPSRGFLFLAEREGFEPSMRINAYSLSRGAPSATRPPLRICNTHLTCCSDSSLPRRSAFSIAGSRVIRAASSPLRGPLRLRFSRLRLLFSHSAFVLKRLSFCSGSRLPSWRRCIIFLNTCLAFLARRSQLAAHPLRIL